MYPVSSGGTTPFAASAGHAFRSPLYWEVAILTTSMSPATLAEMGSPLAEQGVDYTLQGDSSFLLIKTVQGETIVFDSAQDDPAVWVGTIQISG